MELEKIPYLHRSSAAGLLISKANRLTEINDIMADGELSAKKRKAFLKGVHFYEIALLLMKPFDPNYSTIMNWKCLALIRLGRFIEAVEGYEEIVRISDQTDGKGLRNATALLAEEQIQKYQNRENIPSDADSGEDTDAFDDPPYCMFAEDFCELLAKKKYRQAHAYLSEKTKEELTVSELGASWKNMTEGADLLDIELQKNMTDWPTRRKNEIAWCYFSVTGEEYSEAVAVVVAITEFDSYEITEIEFGRP